MWGISQSDLTIGENVPEISQDVVRCFREKIIFSRLLVQLPMLSGVINNTFANTSIMKVTSVRTTTNALNNRKLFEGMFSEVDKLYFTFPEQVQLLNNYFLLCILSKSI